MTFNAMAPSPHPFPGSPKGPPQSWLDAGVTKALWWVLIIGNALFVLAREEVRDWRPFEAPGDIAFRSGLSAVQYGTGAAILLLAIVGLLALYGRTWALLPATLFGALLLLLASDAFNLSDLRQDPEGVRSYLLTVAVEAGTRIGAWPIIIGTALGIYRFFTTQLKSVDRLGSKSA